MLHGFQVGIFDVSANNIVNVFCIVLSIVVVLNFVTNRIGCVKVTDVRLDWFDLNFVFIRVMVTDSDGRGRMSASALNAGPLDK